MTTQKRTTLCCTILMAALVSNANGQLVDFEPNGGLLPDGTLAVDDIAISTQYAVSPFNVSFFIDTNGSLAPDPNEGFPILEGRGSADGGGFTCDGCGPNNTSLVDIPHLLATSNIDDFFLRHVFGTTETEHIVIAYGTPVQQASGEIWDIDSASTNPLQIGSAERFSVEALDSFGTPIATDLSPQGLHPNDPNSLNGKPWLFQLDVSAQPEMISFVRIFIPLGYRTNTGFALDNFSPASIVPEPTSLALLAMGLAGLIGLRRKRE